jgi:hypothetical protein
VLHELVRDSRFYEMLLGLDKDIAKGAHEAGCPYCAAVEVESALHRGNYERKPRGLPFERCLCGSVNAQAPSSSGLLPSSTAELSEATSQASTAAGAPLVRPVGELLPEGEAEPEKCELLTRFSFSCAREGCRRRVTPPSFRFLSRRVYWGAIFVLVSAMQHGATPERRAELRAVFGMCPRTLERWRRWWHETFALSGFWKRAQGAFKRPVNALLLPRSLLDCFPSGVAEKQLELVLRFLSPITSAVGLE